MKNLFSGMRGNPAAAGAAASATAGPAATPQAQPFRRQSFGFGPPRGSPQQLEMVSSLVQSAMSAAQGSNNPILSFLAPLLGSAAMGRASSLQGEAQSAALSDMGRSLYGRDLTEQELGLLGIANNEDAPAMFRERARKQLEEMLLASALSGGGGGSTPSPNPSGGRGGGRGAAPARGGSGAPMPADDGVATLTDALAAGATPAPSVIAELEATMANPRATAQSRSFAEEMLSDIYSGERVVGTRPPATPQLSVTPPRAPVTPMAQSEEERRSNQPPPPPGTVPY